MKEKELRSFSVCGNCNKKIGHTGIPLFWVVSIERFGLDKVSLDRQTGLEMMMGGHVGLAQAMSPDEDLATSVMDKVTFSLCESCATENLVIAGLAESNEKQEAT